MGAALSLASMIPRSDTLLRLRPCRGTMPQRGRSKSIAKSPVTLKKATGMSSRLLILMLLLYVLGAPVSTSAAPLIVGVWVLDEKTGPDPDDVFKGKLRHESSPVPRLQSGGQRNTPHDVTQLAYWDTVRKGEEAHASKNLRRLGTAYPLVQARRLEISDEEGGYRLTYDGDLPRTVRPNPTGKVYSAKGDELIQDTFGYTLSYWDKDSLVLEADAPEGGKVIEHLTVRENPHQLEYVVRVQLPILMQPVEIKRLFNPANGAR